MVAVLRRGPGPPAGARSGLGLQAGAGGREEARPRLETLPEAEGSRFYGLLPPCLMRVSQDPGLRVHPGSRGSGTDSGGSCPCEEGAELPFQTTALGLAVAVPASGTAKLRLSKCSFLSFFFKLP